MKARRSVFAGSWYPGDPDGCEREIKDFLKQSDTSSVSDRKLVGGITPHAGWFFSGSIACNVINSLKGEDPVDVIVIFGMHLHPDSPNYMMKQGAWETPFGELQIAEELAEELARRFKFNIETSERFSRDNTIELQLPFIKYFFKDTKIIPIGVPPAEKSLEIGKVAVELSKELGLQMKVIGSTDLTHYGSNYGYEPKGTGAKALDWVRTENDRGAIDAMVAMEPEEVIREGLSNQNACCAGAAATAIAAAKQLGAEKGESIAYATSYDKSPGSSFVGYAGIVF